MDIIEETGYYGIVPVIVMDKAADAINLGQALLDGGLPIAEITFRTQAAGEAIRIMSDQYPEICVGAGSVLGVEQAEKAVAAGAQFIVSPGLSRSVVDWCLGKKIACFPGVASPSEIMAALELGLKVLKFFPAGALGGAKTLKSIAAPFPGIKYIPTGGISPANLEEYLGLSVVHAVGGSWLVKKSLIAEGRFEEVTSLTSQALKTIRQIRGAY